MKDQRLRVFESAVEGLIDSLQAVVRLARWTGDEPKPEPLVSSAAKLLDRLGTADRLASSKFQGKPSEATRVAAMCAAMKRLDAAYLAYRQQSESTAGSPDPATALETEVAAVAESSDWR
jgi:hypothetical protein